MWENSPVKSSVAPLLRALHRAYPRADCALAHRNPFELLIATILSAQCTDARVNEVTPVLFGRFPNAEVLARAPLGEVETIIRSTGFFRQKALSLLATARTRWHRPGCPSPDPRQMVAA
jgi:endonuclease-3